MRYGSVCSGIEAATVAWKPLGWEAAFVSEIDAFPRAVLTERWPEIPLHGDFTTIGAADYGSVDVLVGGTPCQSFSVAGLRGGLADERGNLALEYFRLADRLRPRWLVWENVPGVLSSHGGRDFGSILGALALLGYGFAYRVLDAQFFGVAQRRRRVFVVGHLGDWRRAVAVLLERQSLRGDSPPRRNPQADPAGDLGGRAAFGGNNTGGAIDVATAVNAHGGPHGRLDFESETFVAHTLRGDGFDASEDGSRRGTPLIPVAFSIMPMNSGKDYKARPVEVSQPVMGSGPVSGSQGGDYILQPVAFSSKDHGADVGLDISPTLRAGVHSGSHANGGVPPAVAFALRGREGGAMPEVTGDHVSALRSASGGSSRDYVAMHGVRRLTPRECERLQGFPDDYTLIPWRKGMAPDGPRYRAVGNSMAVPVMRWLGERIALVDALEAAA